MPHGLERFVKHWLLLIPIIGPLHQSSATIQKSMHSEQNCNIYGTIKTARHQSCLVSASQQMHTRITRGDIRRGHQTETHSVVQRLLCQKRQTGKAMVIMFQLV